MCYYHPGSHCPWGCLLFPGSCYMTWPQWTFNSSSFFNCGIRPRSWGQGPLWYEHACVCVMLLAFPAAFEDGCRWNANYLRPRGRTRAQFKDWAGCSRTSKLLGWICSALRLSCLQSPIPQLRRTLFPFHYMHYTSTERGFDWLYALMWGPLSAYAFVSMLKWEALVSAAVHWRLLQSPWCGTF